MKTLNTLSVRLSCLVLYLACFMVSGVLAQDDAGGRSILSEGAGNRALGLGGAYAGVADDASAVLWNPAGLGLVQRQEFQATHTNLMGMGFYEQYASFVLPNWRWGVGSLTFRRFGVDGIEARDDRNILTDADLSDHESELTVGYGRELGAAWSVGAAFKVRNQNLAGFSDTGIGVDLGMMVRPLVALGSTRASAPNLTMGLAVRNLLEPSLRLNEEPVPDPTGFRVGGAYRWNFSRDGQLLLALDVEKTRDMDTHLHAGLEARLLQPLALRVGTNQGRLVAGAGISWRSLGVDYQFEDYGVDFFHRFGLSLKFGKTRDEKRQLALAREDEALQDRLDTAFATQQKERRDDLLLRARAAIQAKDTPEAANLTAMLKVIDPTAAELASLEKETLLLQAAEREDAGDLPGAMVALREAVDLDPDDPRASAMLQRLRAADDLKAKRTVEIRGLLDGALDAFAAGDLLTAETGFRDVLAVAPGDQEAQAMLVRTDLAKKTRIEEHLAQAGILTDAKRFNRAQEELNAARLLSPDASGLNSAQRRIDAGRAAAEAAQKVVTAPTPEAEVSTEVAAEAVAAIEQPEPGLTAEQQREVADYYQRGIVALDAGQKDQALRLWELVWSMDPEYQNVTELLSRNYLSQGMEFFVAGDLTAAVDNWESAVRVDPTDPKALGYLQRAREQAERMRMMDN